MRSLLAALLLAVVVASPASAEIVDRVVAVVNDEAIFLWQVRQRSVPFLDQIRAARTQEDRVRMRDELYQRVLDELIDEELIRQAARELDITVTQSEVERAIRNVIVQNGMDEETFWAAVRGQGYTEAGYRADVARQLLRLKVLNQRVRDRVNITEPDVRREYDQQLRLLTRRLRFRASHIFFPLAEDASPPEVARARQEAEQLRTTIHDAAGFELAIEGHIGGELGWLNQGDLPPALEEALQALQPGEVSAPVRGESGYHIFLLHERERGDADVPTYEEVRDEIYGRLLEEAMARQEQLYLEELRRNATILRRL